MRAGRCGEEDLFKDERGRCRHSRHGGDFVRHGLIVFDVLSGLRRDENVRVGAEDFGLNIFLEAGHDA